ncbi:MAG: hypothetical protein ACYDHY_07045 [Acidiferrobacterales bacterium]
MNIIEKLLCCFFEHVDIIKEVNGEKVVYLRRWFISQGPKGSVYLHRILRSDDDPDPHDHPWDFKTFIIKGGYDDVQYTFAEKVVHELEGTTTIHPARRFYLGKERVRPGQFLFRPAEHCHQVKLRNDKPAWTLVFLGLKRRDWCFVTAAGPVLWKQYLNVWNDESPYDRVGTDPDYKSGV